MLTKKQINEAKIIYKKNKYIEMSIKIYNIHIQKHENIKVYSNGC